MFELVIIQTKCGDLEKLFDFLICQFAFPVHAFTRMSFHIIGPSDSVCMGFLPAKQWFEKPAEIRDSSKTVFLHDLQVRLAFTLRPSQVYLILQQCCFLAINLFHPFVPLGFQLLFFPPIDIKSTWTERNKPFFAVHE